VVSGPEVVEAGLKSKGFGTALCACLNKSFPTVEAGRTKNRRNAPVSTFSYVSMGLSVITESLE
jgi:hypothetical protein